jgi:hypothetical protein
MSDPMTPGEIAAYRAGAEAMQEKAAMRARTEEEPDGPIPKALAEKGAEIVGLAAVRCTKAFIEKGIRDLSLPEPEPAA